MHCDNTLIVSDPILQCRTLWTVVVCGKVIPRPGSVVTMAQAGIHHGRWVDRVRDVRRNHEAVVADTDGVTSEGGSYSFGP